MAGREGLSEALVDRNMIVTSCRRDAELGRGGLAFEVRQDRQAGREEGTA